MRCIPCCSVTAMMQTFFSFFFHEHRCCTMYIISYYKWMMKMNVSFTTYVWMYGFMCCVRKCVWVLCIYSTLTSNNLYSVYRSLLFSFLSFNHSACVKYIAIFHHINAVIVTFSWSFFRELKNGGIVSMHTNTQVWFICLSLRFFFHFSLNLIFKTIPLQTTFTWGKDEFKSHFENNKKRW